MRVDIARQDTICAVATALTPSAIAVVRVSGPNALAVKESVFRSLKNNNDFFMAIRGDVIHPRTGAILDDAICIAFPDGKSYTGEPVFEFNLHGSPVIVRAVLEVLQIAGCRLAEPGEFSMRAVLSGKLDLCAAEAVYDLIHARSQEAASAALKTLRGGLEQQLSPVRHAIIDALCEIEARLDFPDEDLGDASRQQILYSLQAAISQLNKLLASAQMGQRLMEGARVVLFGEPNVGKSTLMNALVGEERALVHNSPGTTRDVLEAVWNVDGIPVTLVDVAGIRDINLADPVEVMGIERARREIEKADVVLCLQQAGSFPISCETIAKIIHVATKADLYVGDSDCLSVSAKTGMGLEQLALAVKSLLVDNAPAHEEVFLTRARQKEEVQYAKDALDAAYQAIDLQEAAEITASELRAAGGALDRLLGKEMNEDVLDLIFSRFCIGK